ncbi:GNAT family N-acetyltransferase [Microbacterium sp.]|uniref:GNAT family N-acetyltransferase n=1 Tax=Microbacterium sp. TaxID=51671 RepID=UPI002811F8B1|nr:GNAT family N-acetyltransferase [Microbacterium sp.]
MRSVQAEPWQIRPARADDEREVARLYDVCLRTGANGEDATAMFHDPRILGDLFVGPYLRLEPELAWVLLDAGGEPAGFVLGAADTAQFEAAAEKHWWPAVRVRHADAAVPGEERSWGDASVRRAILSPPVTPPAVTEEYPAHLHIDLLPQAQGAGHGRRLIGTLLAALEARSVPGVHLGVGTGNVRAIGFYRRLGFDLIADEGSFLRLGLRLPRVNGSDTTKGWHSWKS